MSALRTLFGPTKKEIWQQLCAQIGANYVRGGFWRGDKVQAVHGEWIITLDTYKVSKTVYTRLRAPYVNPDEFRFTIYRSGLFSGIAKWLGMQDLEIDHADFDGAFVVKGNDESRVRMLFDNPRLRQLIAAQAQIHLTVKDDEGIFGPAFPLNTDELCFHVPGIIKDVERLKLLFELFAETLDQLCNIGSAYEKAPRLRL